jgi:hypothetical protein
MMCKMFSRNIRSVKARMMFTSTKYAFETICRQESEVELSATVQRFPYCVSPYQLLNHLWCIYWEKCPIGGRTLSHENISILAM